MRELITIAASFVIVVGLALYMFISNKEHSIASTQAKELNEIVEKNRQELSDEIERLKARMDSTDEIYHKRKYE